MRKIGDLENKRGSHVGMILSFVIFIVFLVFLYTTLEPRVKTQRDKQLLIDHIKNDIINEITGNLSIATIETELDAPSDANPQINCIEISGLPNLDGNKYAIVRDKDDQIVESNIVGDKIQIKWDGQSEEFFKVYYSEEEFIPHELEQSDCISNEVYYEIKSVRNEQQNFLSRIIKAVLKSRDDHEGVREFLGVPADSDFKVGAKLPDWELVDNLPETETSIYSDKINFQYVNLTAGINTGEMYISVW